MTQLALAWKLLKDLEEAGVGTREVESEEKKRRRERIIKKGMWIKNMKFGEEEMGDRNEHYMKGLLKLRSEPARADWEEAREIFRKGKEKLRCQGMGATEQNRSRSFVRQVIASCDRLFQEGRARHQQKVKHLVESIRT